MRLRPVQVKNTQRRGIMFKSGWSSPTLSDMALDSPQPEPIILGSNPTHDTGPHRLTRYLPEEKSEAFIGVLQPNVAVRVSTVQTRLLTVAGYHPLDQEPMPFPLPHPPRRHLPSSSLRRQHSEIDQRCLIQAHTRSVAWWNH
jgi:hypothetical protein